MLTLFVTVLKDNALYNQNFLYKICKTRMEMLYVILKFRSMLG